MCSILEALAAVALPKGYLCETLDTLGGWRRVPISPVIPPTCLPIAGKHSLRHRNPIKIILREASLPQSYSLAGKQSPAPLHPELWEMKEPPGTSVGDRESPLGAEWVLLLIKWEIRGRNLN